MPKTYFDDRGRAVPAERILQDLLSSGGKNRELAMKQLGVTQTRAPRPIEIQAEVLTVDGKKKARVRRVVPE